MDYHYEVFRTPLKVIMQKLAENCKQRRLEKGLSRKSLSAMSNVPAPTIERFETKYAISLESYVRIADALGYSEEILSLMSQPKFSTMKELETITKNKHRERGV